MESDKSYKIARELYKIQMCLLILSFFGLQSLAQNCNDMDIQLQSDIPSTCNAMVMTMIHDQLDRPYLYIANKEAGLTIYNISNISSPEFVASLPSDLFGSLHAMNLIQDGNYIFLALGNHFTNPQQGGLAIVDVSDSEAPELLDFYVLPSSASGAGIVKVEGDYAYLGAMKSGLIILDVSDKNDIIFISQFVPDINYPVPNPNPDLYNARGVAVKNSIVYLCYDAGGLRIINCTDKTTPLETGHYANPEMFLPLNLPRAYNNLELDDSLVYISVDYCGLEILNISDTSDITLAGWWNPYQCPNNNWFTSPSHTNELYFNKNCKQLFVSTGKSDMIVIDVSDPSQPDSCNFYGGVSNNIGTWGVSAYQNEIYLSYICAFIPFASNWTGVKILSYSACSPSGFENINIDQFSVFPNPAGNEVNISGPIDFNDVNVVIYNSLGQFIKQVPKTYGNKLTVDTRLFPNGLYIVAVRNSSKQITQKFLVNN